MKPLPHSSSVRALGLAATTSAKDRPCFLQCGYFFAEVDHDVTEEHQVGFPTDGAVPRGMTIILSVTFARFASAARMVPSMLPPVE